MMSNKLKRVIAFYMIKELGSTVNKMELTDWIIQFCKKKHISDYDIAVKDIVELAKNVGISVRA